MMGAGTDYGFGRGPSLWGEESGFWGCSLSALKCPPMFRYCGEETKTCP